MFVQDKKRLPDGVHNYLGKRAGMVIFGEGLTVRHEHLQRQFPYFRDIAEQLGLGRARFYGDGSLNLRRTGRW
jgi:hypothetical protein